MIRVQGLGFEGLGFRDLGVYLFTVQGLGFRGLPVCGSGLRV